jgi:hypothetical protein
VLHTVDFKPLALVSGSAALGVRVFRPRSSELPDYTGVVARARLAYTMQGTTRFRFSADRDLAYSYSPDEPYYMTNGFGVGVDRHLGGRFELTGGGDFQTFTYRRRIQTGPPIQASVQSVPASVTHMTTWSLGVGYRLARSRRVGLDVTYRERDPNSAQFRPYSGLRVMWSVDSGL